MALVDDQHGLWSNFYVGNYALALQEANDQNGFVVRAEFCEKNPYISIVSIIESANVVTTTCAPILT